MSRRSIAPWLGLAGLVGAVVIAVYAVSLHNGFVFDDLDLVVGDPLIQRLGDVKLLFANAYRPLRTLTYAVDYAVWGLNPMGFRITNIAIHVLNCALALFVARKLTGGARIAALAATLLFALHPVQVESVAYISGRRDVLFALFYLAAFLAFIRFREATTRAAQLGWLAATGVGFVLSLLSKEMAASFPVACLLWDVFRATEPAEGERPRVGTILQRLVRQGAVLYGVGVVALALFAYYTIFIRHATTRLGESVEFWGGSLLDNTLTVPLTYAHYVRLTVWPVTLAAQYYGAFDPAAGFTDPRVVPALLLLVGLAAASLYLMARTSFRVAGFGIAWFLVTLLPASQIIPHHEIVADHYLYLPLVGVGLGIADVLRRFERDEALQRWRTVAVGAVAVVLVLLTVRTVLRERDWRDEPTLWEATYKAVPESPRAAYNYALVLTNRGAHQQAIPYYQQAIAADPTFVKAYFNLASTYAGLGRIDEARAVYKAALGSDLDASARTWHMTPDVLRAIYETELAMLDAQAGRTEQARDALATIVGRFPDLMRAEEFYWTVLKARGETAQAIETWRARAAAAPPDAVADRIVLASLLWRAGSVDEAFQLFSNVVATKPNSPLANLYLGQYYRDIRPSPADARKHFDVAVATALTPFDADAARRVRGDVVTGTLAG